MNIQWYPGHMTKAKRAMQEDLKLVDLIIELVDARVPLSSRNPDIDELGAHKARLILLNKSDMAREEANERWADWFRGQGYQVVKVNSRSGAGLKQIQAAVQEACKEKLERDMRRGIKNRPVRAMVAGIPNVGKSTFINSFAGKACTKTGNKPGVTKGNQWIRMNKALELLDTPGILWPKFDDQQVGIRLAMIGSINDEILDREELAVKLIRFLDRYHPDALRERYALAGLDAQSGADGRDARSGTDGQSEVDSRNRESVADMQDGLGGPDGCDDREAADGCRAEDGRQRLPDGYHKLRQIARARGCLLKGNELDTRKAANLLLEDFRSGRLGRITLEFPPEQPSKS